MPRTSNTCVEIRAYAFTVGFSATGTFKRSDFGVTKYVPLIGDEVHLMITAAFEKQG